MHRRVRLSIVVSAACALIAMASTWAQNNESNRSIGEPAEDAHPFLTFVELGSVNCVPCRQMQPVMKAIEHKYGSQISVVFHDVWKPDQRDYVKKYNVRVIPTQVLLDRGGKEVFRHEGFFPEAEIDKLLQKHGLKQLIGG